MRLLLLLLAGCAPTVQTIRIPVVPSCEVKNVLEQCKLICLRDGKRAIQATETDTELSCNCSPFDAMRRLHLLWEAPGPRKVQRRLVGY